MALSLEKHRGLNDRISQEAAEWLVELRTGDIDLIGRRHLDSWLRVSPEHVRAFIEMAALWHDTGAIDPQHKLEVEAIVGCAQKSIAAIPLRTADP